MRSQGRKLVHVEFEPRDWITVIAIISSAFVLILSPFLAAYATGNKEKKARTEERRDEAYTRLVLVLRKERDGIEAVAWLGAEAALVEIPDPEEAEWVEARVNMVGSERVRTKLAHVRETMTEFYISDSNYYRLLERTREEGRDPLTDSDCAAMGHELQKEAVAVLLEINEMEEVLRSDITS